MLPPRFQSSFSPATLKTVETQAAKLQLRELLFFRGAHTANVVENERRSFSPIVVIDAGGIAKARCTCIGWMKLGDLCRHLAVLVERSADREGSLPSERFESSVWRTIAIASFADGREISADDYVDPREQLLRKYVMTETEQELVRRGSGSARLQFEASRWYRWAIERFERGDEARLELQGGTFHLNGIALPAAAVESLVTSGVAATSGFEVVHDALTPSLRITIENGALRFTPVLIWSAATAVAAFVDSARVAARAGKAATAVAALQILDRLSLPRFGKYFLLGNRFASVRAALPMFIERSAREQAALFEVRPSAGLPYDRESVVAAEHVFRFVETHREELAAMPPELAPECVRDAKPVRLDDEVVFDFSAPERDLLEIDIIFSHGVRAGDIARARREHVRALIRGNVWIDVTDPQFAWLDHATIGPEGRVLVTKLELLRIRGSLRGSAVFRGDAGCEPVFRMFDELQIAGDAPSPAALGIDLYGYQQTGYHWLWLLQQNGFGGLLCDDMGLGKTHQAMALIAAMAHVNPAATVLVVCPTSLIDHWKEKLRCYLPGTPVTLTSYGIVRSRIEQFRGRRFDLLVLDEMQTIKNADTSTHQALRAIDKVIAVGLTGTPIENHERELTALLDFVVPGYLPKHVEDRATLQRLVRPFVLRRTKAQVLPDLPPKIVDKRYCELNSEQRALYRRVLESRAKPLRMQIRAGAHVSYVHVFAALNFLKQICNHPASAGGGFASETASSAKWELFVDLLAECMASGLKVVVFSQYLKMLELIERHLDEESIRFASIKGATRDRGGEVARFQDDADCRVFTASLRAGGLGIDLTSASVVIHYDRWWNQAREDQATDRVHRLGQSRGVQVIKLITRGTVEEKIDELIARKARLTTELIQDDDPSLVKQFTVDELDELLSD